MGDEGKDKPKVSAPFPAMATDFAIALREFIETLRDLGRAAMGLNDIWQRHKSKQAARDLAELVFVPHGAKKYLERIASGVGIQSDLKQLRKLVAITAGKSAEIVEGLDRFRDKIRERFGLGVALKLDSALRGDLYGKGFIWQHIARLSDERGWEATENNIQNYASELLKAIEVLNNDNHRYT